MSVPFTQLVASTYDAVVNEKNKAADQWSDTSGLNFLEKLGGVKRVTPGATLQMTLDYRANSGADFLATDTTATSTSKTDVLTATGPSWATLVVPTNWSFTDEALNNGDSQDRPARVLADNAITTHDYMIEQAMFATTGGTDGFATFIGPVHRRRHRHRAGHRRRHGDLVEEPVQGLGHRHRRHAPGRLQHAVLLVREGFERPAAERRHRQLDAVRLVPRGAHPAAAVHGPEVGDVRLWRGEADQRRLHLQLGHHDRAGFGVHVQHQRHGAVRREDGVAQAARRDRLLGGGDGQHEDLLGPPARDAATARAAACSVT
jgi:hypothetical protein